MAYRPHEVDALLEYSTNQRQRADLACELARQLLSAGEDGLSEEDLDVGWQILSDLEGEHSPETNPTQEKQSA